MMAVTKPQIMLTAIVGDVGLNLLAQVRGSEELQEKTMLWWSLFPCTLLTWVTCTYFRQLIESRRYPASAFLWSEEEEIGSSPKLCSS